MMTTLVINYLDSKSFQAYESKSYIRDGGLPVIWFAIPGEPI
jgi:hypothetical protein